MSNIKEKNILPIKNKILVKKIYRKKINNIEIPYDETEEKLILGEVISLSEESKEFFNVKDQIFFSKYSFNKIETFESFLNEEVGFVAIDDIFAIVRDK